jgi:hypothetical protein
MPSVGLIVDSVSFPTSSSTIFEEWYSTLLIPWYHYVPVQVSFNDL